ncbi:MAG: ribonuclease H-like domain-containing protein [Candidatus Omnitrophica bacterium]|nr:ribonuclease H-like domain-containing protein [Candidatus Omnitrophota bacterium]
MGLGNKPERIVLDLETKKSFAEVGRQNLQLLGVSLAGIYSYREDKFRTFEEKDLKQLLPYLQQAELVIGFNIKKFDFPVLQPYLDLDLKQLKVLDILEEIHNSLGFRLSLDSIAKATLEIGKKGTGLDALKYFRQGQINKLKEYCQHDVFVTREIYEYGRRHGHLLYFRGTAFEAIPASWAEYQTIKQLLREAFDKRKTLEIEYSSPSNNAGQRHCRQIDIYDFDLGKIIAYCHLRGAMRTFNLRRVLSIGIDPPIPFKGGVLSAKLTENKYEIPADFNLQEFKARQKF